MQPRQNRRCECHIFHRAESCRKKYNQLIVQGPEFAMMGVVRARHLDPLRYYEYLPGQFGQVFNQAIPDAVVEGNDGSGIFQGRHRIVSSGVLQSLVNIAAGKRYDIGFLRVPAISLAILPLKTVKRMYHIWTEALHPFRVSSAVMVSSGKPPPRNRTRRIVFHASHRHGVASDDGVIARGQERDFHEECSLKHLDYCRTAA
jgi:hypothetical protein